MGTYIHCSMPSYTHIILILTTERCSRPCDGKLVGVSSRSKVLRLAFMYAPSTRMAVSDWVGVRKALAIPKAKAGCSLLGQSLSHT